MFLALRPLKFGVILTLLAFLFGFGLGGAFGAAEDAIKGKLRRDGEAALDSAYGGDEAKMNKVVSKSWVYLKRAHMHGGGMAAAALAMILLLATLPGGGGARKLTAFLLGAGSLGYPIFWLLAGLKAPGLGSTGAAKESLKLLALPSSGAFLLGTAMTLVLFTKAALLADPEEMETTSIR
jgi:hypothetical protein